MEMKSRCQLVGIVLTLLSLTWHSSALAGKFANQFTEFELPPAWACNLEGAEWVCQSTNEANKRDAIIVLAAKLKGDQDTLDQYNNYLKAPKNYTSVQGKSVRSEPKYAKYNNINGQTWVDALHLESEIPGFYTRYLATIKNDIGVLVTYSINKNKYQQYIDVFENMVKTLKVFRKPGVGLNAGVNGQPPAITIPAGVDTSATGFTAAPVNPGGNQKPARKDNSLLLILIVAAVAGFIVWKRRQSAD